MKDTIPVAIDRLLNIARETPRKDGDRRPAFEEQIELARRADARGEEEAARKRLDQAEAIILEDRVNSRGAKTAIELAAEELAAAIRAPTPLPMAITLDDGTVLSTWDDVRKDRLKRDPLGCAIDDALAATKRADEMRRTMAAEGKLGTTDSSRLSAHLNVAMGPLHRAQEHWLSVQRKKNGADDTASDTSK